MLQKYFRTPDPNSKLVRVPKLEILLKGVYDGLRTIKNAIYPYLIWEDPT